MTLTFLDGELEGAHPNHYDKMKKAKSQNELGPGRAGLTLAFNMRLGRFCSMVHSVFVLTAS